MELEIRRAAVIGAGWMGTSIAALIASAGIDTLLLDVLPPMEPSEEEQQRGITRFSESWRSSLARTALAGAIARDAFLDPDASKRVKPGNIVDQLDQLAEMDWIIEAVPEVLGVKRATYDRILSHVRSDAIITSNTSGLLVKQLAEGLPESFAKQFFVSHFFNPVRQTMLCELVPGEQTDQRVFEQFRQFVNSRLGKGVIVSGDTPYFIANRLGLFTILTAMTHAEAQGISVGECDRLTGYAMARPGSGTFRTADIVGLDSMLQVFDNMHGSLAGDPCRDRFNAPAFFRMMIEKGLWGDKTGGGFYRRKEQDGRLVTETLRFGSLEYGRMQPREFESLAYVEGIQQPGARVRALVESDDPAGRFAWACVRDMLLYAGHLLGRIADQPLTIDRAMRWGYNWDLGPFEVWDALGVDKVLARMEADGFEPPESAKRLKDAGFSSWYLVEDAKRKQFMIDRNEMQDAAAPKGVLTLDDWSALKQANSFTLYDLGDGIGCLSIAPPHGDGLRVNSEFVEALDELLDEVADYKLRGMIVFSQADDFSPGMHQDELLALCEAKDWKTLEEQTTARQAVNQRLKAVGLPVVAAIAGHTYGAGYELAMHCSRIQAHVETQISMNAVRYGLIPSGGGCKEMLFRAVENTRIDGPHPIVARAFEAIMRALVARGAYSARQHGLLRKVDKFSMGRKMLLADAKYELLNMLEHGFSPPPRPALSLPGPGGAAWIDHQIAQYALSGELTAESVVIGRKLAYVLTGGNCSPVDRLTEDDLLELEREAFLSLCGMEQTLRLLKAGISRSAG